MQFGEIWKMIWKLNPMTHDVLINKIKRCVLIDNFFVKHFIKLCEVYLKAMMYCIKDLLEKCHLLRRVSQ